MRRLHPLTIVVGAAASLSRLVWLLLLTPFLVDWQEVTPGEAVTRFLGVLGIVLLAGVLNAGLAAVVWWSRRYGTRDGKFVWTEGILGRRTRTIPFARIQDIQNESGLLQRLFGLTTVRLETAGSEDAEAELAVVSREEAERLREEILGGRRETAAPPTEEAPPRWGLAPRDLLLAGSTETRLGWVLAGAFALWQFSEDFGKVGDRVLASLAGAIDGVVGAGPTARALAGAAAVLGLLAAGWVASILFALVRWWGFTVTRQGGSLRRAHGLLTRYDTALPLRRVQSVVLEQNLLRRWMGLGVLRAGTAGSAKDRASGGSPVLFPLVRAGEAGSLVRAVFPALDWDDAALRPAGREALRRELLETGVSVLLLASAAAPFAGWAVLPALPVLAALGALRARNRWRALGHAVTPSHVLVRAGVWRRTTRAVPLAKIQCVTLARSPWQRLFGLADLTVETAASGSLREATVRDLSVEEAEALYRECALAAARGGRGRGGGPAPPTPLPRPPPRSASAPR